MYVNGVFVADEPGFVFSYNITKLLPSKRKGLNRDRRSISRDLYRERVVGLIEKAESPEVLDILRKALKDQRTGGELAWKPVFLKAAASLQASQKVVYFTPAELETNPSLVSDARRDGFEPVTISEDQRRDMLGFRTPSGDPLRTSRLFAQELQSKFQYQFVDALALDDDERAVLDLTPSIATMVTRLRPPQVLISEALRLDDDRVLGLWDPELGKVIIKRSELQSPESFAATLLHELAHWDSRGKDQSFEFEACLTKYLGRLAVCALPTIGFAHRRADQPHRDSGGALEARN